MFLIKLLTDLLGGKAWLAWLVVAFVGLGGLGAAYAYVDHSGYARASSGWTVKYDDLEAAVERASAAETARQSQANEAAKSAEASAVQVEQDREASLEATITELQVEADSDPNKDRVGLGADSVNRLNRIK